MTRSTASAPVYSMFARVVSKWVLFGTTRPGPPDHAEEDLLRGATLVGREDVRGTGTDRCTLLEPEPRRRTGVRLVAALDARPLLAATSPRCRSR